MYFNTPEGVTNQPWGSQYTYSFKSDGLFAASGNIMSLVVKDGLTDEIPQEDWYFYGLFANCMNITKAPALPATTLADSCYSNMFAGCERLTTAPELPAQTLKRDCYANMFEGCYGLTQAPALPATTLAGNCYDNMFNDCDENISEVHMKSVMQGVYKPENHGKFSINGEITIVYDL